MLRQLLGNTIQNRELSQTDRLIYRLTDATIIGLIQLYVATELGWALHVTLEAAGFDKLWATEAGIAARITVAIGFLAIDAAFIWRRQIRQMVGRKPLPVAKAKAQWNPKTMGVVSGI